MRLEFVKMNGLGNDFVVVDATQQPFELNADQIRAIADRRRGVGFDQLLVIEPPKSKAADVLYRIFNADGGEVGQCGNGVRCVARYLRDRGKSTEETLVAESGGRLQHVYFEANGAVRVNMGAPVLEPELIPLQAETRAERYVLEVDGQPRELGAVSMGNPHAVLEVDDLSAVPVAQWGPLIQTHSRFPAGANAGFMQIVDASHIRLRVFERGVGETSGCGTGACAAVVAGRLWSRLDAAVDVELPGGHLLVEWQGEGEPVWMTGPADQVFEGSIEL